MYVRTYVYYFHIWTTWPLGGCLRTKKKDVGVEKKAPKHDDETHHREMNFSCLFQPQKEAENRLCN